MANAQDAGGTPGDDDFDVIEAGSEEHRAHEADTADDTEDTDTDTDTETEGEGEDERLNLDADDADEKRKAKRDAKKASRERRRLFEQKERLEREQLRNDNAALRAQMEQINARLLQQDSAALDNRLSVAQHAFHNANAKMAEATRTGNGQALVAAQNERDRAAADYNQAKDLKARVAAAPQQTQPQQQQQQVDPRLKAHAEKFTADNAWLKQPGNEIDAAVVMAIDNTLTQQGYDPTSTEYWSELRRLSKERLPHRYRRGGPPVGGGRDTSPAAVRAGKAIVLSPERISALKAAGKWEDLAERKKAAQAYLKFDRENPPEKASR